MQINKIFSDEIVRFFLVGILNTAIGYLLFVIFYFFIQIKIYALLFAYLVGILVNYKTYSDLVFTIRDKRIFINFILIYIVIFIFNILILKLLTEVLTIDVYIAQFIAICMITPILYILNKKYVFIVIKD